MKELHSQIDINASAERVWQLLTDFASYPQWNPFIRRISGEPTTGERLEVRLEPPESRGITLRPKVLAAEPNHQLRWLGHLFVPGLFDGEHSFVIQSLEEDRVLFVQREAFKGLLVPLFARSLDNSTLRGFEEMNRALKERAEAATGGDSRYSAVLILVRIARLWELPSDSCVLRTRAGRSLVDRFA